MSRDHRHWRRGDILLATVVESLEDRELLLRYGGGPEEPASQIMRVANETNRSLAPGDTIYLRIREVAPLKFQYVEDRDEQRRRGRLDVSV